ncbi:uncharacterized protein [Linepithema humile]|uniref:uncharacterized protein n=2 Tax=Linepithema humile TaxID=83485 RepID=UPI00351EFEB1
MYSIVEFNDGIFAIPTIWLSTDKKKAKWPPFDERKTLKAISRREEPDENWEFLSVIRIFGTASDYDNAMKKVSLAEQLTDISDSENAKKTRKRRARRMLSSEDSDNEEYPPRKRSNRIKSSMKKTMNSNIQYPEFPSTSKLPLISMENDNSIEKHDGDTSIVHDDDTSIVQKKNTFMKTFTIKDTSTDIDVDHTSNEKIVDVIEARIQKIMHKSEEVKIQ